VIDLIHRLEEKRDPTVFARKKRVNITPEERTMFNKRLKAAGLRPGSCGLAKTVAGFSAHTHRARTPWVASPDQFEIKQLKWIESTG
jgi:hypothetical protein